MARLINIVWILLFVFQAFYQGLVYTYYVTNKPYIVEQLCENKDQPALKCDGKCHLRQLLQTTPSATSDESSSTPYLPTWEDLKIPVLYCQAISNRSDAPATLSQKPAAAPKNFGYFFAYQYEHNTPHWHPPRMA